MTIKRLYGEQPYVWQEIPYYLSIVDKLRSHYTGRIALNTLNRFIFTYIWSERVTGRVSKYDY